jgi:hypothetical protein
MYKLILLGLIFQLTCLLNTFSNSKIAGTDTVVANDFDKIIKTNSVELIVRVNRLSNSEVFYVYPLNKEELSIPRKNIHRIIYSSGKIENFNPLSENSNEDESSINWENVIVLKNQSEADNLAEISDVDALYESKKMKISTSQLEKNGLMILKKKTANLGGKYILITDKIINKAYGDLPSIEYYGKAYKKK